MCKSDTATLLTWVIPQEMERERQRQRDRARQEQGEMAREREQQEMQRELEKRRLQALQVEMRERSRAGGGNASGAASPHSQRDGGGQRQNGRVLVPSLPLQHAERSDGGRQGVVAGAAGTGTASKEPGQSPSSDGVYSVRVVMASAADWMLPDGMYALLTLHSLVGSFCDHRTARLSTSASSCIPSSLAHT